MDIEVVIDDLTNCLIERATGQEVKTCYKVHVGLLHTKDIAEWNFDWRIPQEKGYAIYELFILNSDTVQGRIALRIDGGVADVSLVETAPQNFGKNGEYIGVGGHLFAIACQVSKQSGCDGYVSFLAKSNLVDYYKEKLHAKYLRETGCILMKLLRCTL